MVRWSIMRGERRLTAGLAGYFFLLVAALYLMKRQKEGGWKIGGCVLVRPEGRRI